MGAGGRGRGACCDKVAMIRHADLSSPADCAAIDAFLDKQIDATPFHRRAWVDAVSQGCGHKKHYLMAYADVVTGVLPLHEIHSSLFGRALVSSGFAVGGGILANDAATVAKAEAQVAAKPS